MDGLQGGTKFDKGATQQQQELQGSEDQTTRAEQIADAEGSSAADKTRADYEAVLKERDERIAALEGKIAERQRRPRVPRCCARRWTSFAARARSNAWASSSRWRVPRNVKAARTLLADYDNDIDKLKADEPWLLDAGAPAPTQAGAPGLPNADAATDEGAQQRRWRKIAGIEDKEEQRMPSSIAYTRNYTAVRDEVYKRAACSTCLNSPHRMARAERNVKEIMVPKNEVTGLGDYTRNVGYKTGSITYEFDTKAFSYNRGIKLLADVIDVEEAGVLDCFVAAGSKLQRTQVAPEADAFTFSEIAGHAGVTPAKEDFAEAEAGNHRRAGSGGADSYRRAPVRERSVQLGGIPALVRAPQ